MLLKEKRRKDTHMIMPPRDKNFFTSETATTCWHSLWFHSDPAYMLCPRNEKAAQQAKWQALSHQVQPPCNALVEKVCVSLAQDIFLWGAPFSWPLSSGPYHQTVSWEGWRSARGSRTGKALYPACIPLRELTYPILFFLLSAQCFNLISHSIWSF